MNTHSSLRRLAIAFILMAAASPALLRATVDDALSFAYEAALPYYKQGFSIRKDAWGGDLGLHDKKAVSSQLFKGNDYWFLMSSSSFCCSSSRWINSLVCLLYL